MLAIGIICLIIAVFAGIPVLYLIGGILACIGAALLVLEHLGGGRRLGGRRWY